MSDEDVLYRINDLLTALASDLQVPFESEDDLTHEIAKRFRVGPYRIGES